MTRLEIARFTRDGIESAIEKRCADVVDCGVTDYSIKNLQKLFAQLEEAEIELKAAYKEENENQE